MNVRFDNDVDTANAVKWYLFVLVISPIAHLCHVFTTSLVLFVTLRKDDVFIETVGEFETLCGFLPRIVVNYVLVSQSYTPVLELVRTSSLNICHFALDHFIPVEPYICTETSATLQLYVPSI